MKGQQTVSLPVDKRIVESLRNAAVPKRAICRNGNTVDTAGEVWVLPEETVDMQINWNLLHAAPDIKNSMKAYIFSKIESQATQSAWTAFNALKNFAEEIKRFDSLSDLSFAEFQNYLNKQRDGNYEWRFGHVRRWYAWCFRQEIGGFDESLLRRLKELKVKAFEAGRAVLARDPEKGPFSDEEFHLLRQAVKEKRGSLNSRVLVMLLLETGARPKQLVLLNESDFKTFRNEDGGEEFYSVQIPCVKRRAVGRIEKKSRRVSQELGQQLSLLIEQNKQIYPDIAGKRPLLFSLTRKSQEPLTAQSQKVSSPLARRMTRPMVRYYVCKFPVEANIVSPLTGKHIDIHPYRLRYTFGTRHANQGTPAAAIAEMLDHSGTESVRVYTKGTNAMVDYLNEALGKNEQFTGLIDKFMGAVKAKTGEESAEKVILGTAPTLKNLGGIGVCGANYLCDLFPPLSCYVCPKFSAWKEGPHEEMLLELEQYVERLSGKFNNPADRIPQQLKNTIVALKSLLNKIREKKNE